MQEHKELREIIMEQLEKAYMPHVKGLREEKVADAIMDAVAERFRSLTEVEEIVETVQAGHNVQVAYWDPDDEDDLGPDGLPDPMIVKPCWGKMHGQQADLNTGGVLTSTMEAAGEAAEELIRARQQGTMTMYEATVRLRELEADPGMERVYVCSQYATRGNKEANLEMAKWYCMMVIEEGKVPICPHLFYGGVLNDEVRSQRAAGLRLGIELLRDCTELRIFSEVSEGMAKEIQKADEWGIPVTVADQSIIYSEDQADFYTERILEELEAVRSGKEYHSGENGQD